MEFVLRSLVVMFAIALVLAAEAVPAWAGAWPQKKGGYYLKFTGNYLSTGRERDFRGDVLDIFQERVSFTGATFTNAGLEAYTEYGWTNRVTLIGKLPFKHVEAARKELGGSYFEERTIAASTTGFGDLQLAVRYGLLSSPLVISAEGGVKIPLGYDRVPANGGPPLGTGEVDADISLLTGASLWPLPLYITGGFGYRTRGGVYSDQILYEMELGLVSERWMMKITVRGVESTTAPQDLVGAPVETPLPGGGGSFQVLVGDQDVTKLNPAIAYAIGNGRWLTVELFEVVAGKNTVDGTTVAAGIVLWN